MKRFEYDRMTASDLQQTLDDIGMTHLAFARIYGIAPRTIDRWLSGDNDIPPYVFVTLRILENVPGAIRVARDAAAEYIRADNDFPERGEYPYRNGNSADD